MNEVEALLSASERFLVPLRLNDGFSEQAYAALVAALHDCAQAWQGAELIPRLAVNVLVDLMPVMEAMADAYQEPPTGRIRQAAFEIHELVQECVALE